MIIDVHRRFPRRQRRSHPHDVRIGPTDFETRLALAPDRLFQKQNRMMGRKAENGLLRVLPDNIAAQMGVHDDRRMFTLKKSRRRKAAALPAVRRHCALAKGRFPSLVSRCNHTASERCLSARRFFKHVTPNAYVCGAALLVYRRVSAARCAREDNFCSTANNKKHLRESFDYGTEPTYSALNVRYPATIPLFVENLRRL